MKPQRIALDPRHSRGVWHDQSIKRLRRLSALVLTAGVLGCSANATEDGLAGPGANPEGGTQPGCKAPRCGACATCFDQCVCTTGDSNACQATCGGGAGSGSSGSSGSSGTGVGGSSGGSAGGASGSGGSSGSSAGSAGVSGTGGVAGSSGSSGGGTTPTIPPAPATCPNIATGNISVMGQQVQLWVGPAGQKGPMVFYWHGTGSNSGEASGGLGPGLNEVRTGGGVVASFTTTTAMGTNTGNNVWYTGDFAMADIIVACADKQGLIDTRQIFTAGCSAGGLQASAMAYGRSSYLAATMPNSGGNVGTYQLQSPKPVPAVITTHGGTSDMVIISFADATTRFNTDIKAKGAFVVNCNHGGGHCASPAAVKTAQWQFLKAHPFGTTPSPYASALPSGFPTSCQIK